MYEQGLIDQYCNQIAGWATRAEEGESIEVVEVNVRAIVEKTLEHFAILKTVDPAVHRTGFRTQLSLRIYACHPSQPRYKKTFEFAVSLLVD